MAVRKRYQTYGVVTSLQFLVSGLEEEGTNNAPSVIPEETVSGSADGDDTNEVEYVPIWKRKKKESLRRLPSLIIPSSESADFDRDMRDRIVFSIFGVNLFTSPNADDLIPLLTVCTHAYSNSIVENALWIDLFNSAMSDALCGLALKAHRSHIQAIELFRRASRSFMRVFSMLDANSDGFGSDDHDDMLSLRASDTDGYSPEEVKEYASLCASLMYILVADTVKYEDVSHKLEAFSRACE